MWRSVGILGCTIFLIAFSANAGLLGPPDFDECILDNMKGVNSDAATKLIARSHAKKFPKTVWPGLYRNPRRPQGRTH